ncbi:hypothetical protein HA402_008993 [Bradysia odoriphaga]|nr:hypothetical protein HA402_008993 [Bradysia odoriphaga]
MGKKKGRSLRKNKSAIDLEPNEVVTAPHSFVLHRGLPCLYISDLTRDFRRMMEPFTASALKERKNNKIKDFVSLSGVFHVSHMCVFNKTKNQLSFKVARLPRGPTLTFKVHQFTLAKDVIALHRRQFVDEEAFQQAPLIIQNNFTGEGKHLKLMASTFQNMYPTINLATVNLSNIKRCVLISYNPVTQLLDWRHYSVTVAPVGLSRGIKKVVVGKIPNLGKCEDIADFLTSVATDSEYEDDDDGHVVLPQTLKSRGNVENNKSEIKLHEIGPRLTIELVKVEDGLFTGEILYHKQVVKTEEELAAIQAQREEKRRLKLERKKIQSENVDRKLNEKQSFKRQGKDENDDDRTDEDDDAAYYKEEVGEEPDKDLFTMTNTSRKRGYVPKFMHNKDAKKRKFNNDKERRGDSGKGFGGKDAKKKRFNNDKEQRSKGGKKIGNKKIRNPKNKKF